MNKGILVVEDERPLQEAISRKLQLNGFSVVTSRTVEQALGYLEDVPEIAAIWLDHFLLGKENGIDFVARIKEHEEWRKIPIFVVSNTAGPDKVQSYLRLGVNKFFVKANYRLDQIIEDMQAVIGAPD